MTDWFDNFVAKERAKKIATEEAKRRAHREALNDAVNFLLSELKDENSQLSTDIKRLHTTGINRITLGATSLLYQTYPEAYDVEFVTLVKKALEPLNEQHKVKFSASGYSISQYDSDYESESVFQKNELAYETCYLVLTWTETTA